MILPFIASCSDSKASDPHGWTFLALRSIMERENVLGDAPAEIGRDRCSQELAERIDPSADCELISMRTMDTTYKMIHLSRQHGVLVILQEGHGTCLELSFPLLDDMRQLAASALEHADVLYVDMPFCGLNRGQPFRYRDRDMSVASHTWFALQDRPGRSSLAYFMHPLKVMVTDLAPRYRAIHMVGRSGGGWTTTVFAAADPRIDVSISVAGSVPFEARSMDIDGIDDIGDWEQSAAYLYHSMDYEDFYALAGTGGRKHVQIYNEFDNCCFAGLKGLEAKRIYEARYADRSNVNFLINPGEGLHVIPVDMVMREIFD